MAEVPATVLVLDDDESMLTAVSRQLRLQGYQVESFLRARDVLEYLQQGEAECLVADLEMPEMSGLELQEAVAQAGYRLSIVFLTGHGDVQSAVKALHTGAIDFLEKPVEQEDLMSAVAKGVDATRQQSRELNENQTVLSKLALLTERQRAVLTAVAEGKQNKQIAYELDITERTVKAHRKQIMDRLEARHVADLVRFVDSLPETSD